ncbi:Mut7-C RNAse domain-containing protein [Actinoallomurus sp. NPDC052308]|uniref:Mut7-C RNAse domain-containing protein n=1 Tax=Actinoallomurus sp. NPDC052308 TaxID=3155530 RepID=UPI00342CB7C5
MGHARLEFAAELRFFLAPAARGGTVLAPLDGTSSLGHVVESVGVPLPEVGDLLVADRPVPPSYRPRDGDVIQVRAVNRPQRLPAGPPRFTLDVHLGKLARRLRLVGVDTDYHNDIDDDALVELADREHRILLTQDRGLLRRRRLWFGAYVRGARPEEQFRDVLDRFAPPLAPWTRCTACNGLLAPVAKEIIEHLLQPGTRRSYDGYAQCRECGRLYWKGAHHRRLQAIVDAALSSS